MDPMGNNSNKFLVAVSSVPGTPHGIAYVYVPGDSLRPFYPLVGGHQQPLKMSLFQHPLLCG